LITRSYGVAEVVIAPRSAAIGRRITPGMVTSGGDMVVLAVERKGEDQGAQGAVLAEGDTLLLRGAWDALDRKLERDPEVLTVDAPQMIRRQAVPLGPRSIEAIMILLAMVVLLATGAVPAAVAGLLAAGAMVLLRVVPLERAYRSISWTTVVLVGAMIPLSQAMQQTGAAERIANGLVDVVGSGSPYLLAAGLFLVTAVLGQLISNMATALIVIPIAVSAAAETGVSGRPLLMTVNVAAAASLLTPVATPVNLMVMGPAGYRFGDYWKLGLPLMAWFFVIAVFLVPVFWSF
jgi:di/tricarboxylate transporter